MALREDLAPELAEACLVGAGQALTGLGVPLLAQVPEAIPSIEYLVMVGVAGEASGSVVVAMAEGSALRLACALLQRPPEDLDEELVCSGLGEVGNIVAGHVATALHEAGIQADIGVPSVVQGEHLAVHVPSRVLHSHQWDTAIGRLAIGIGLARELAVPHPGHR